MADINKIKLPSGAEYNIKDYRIPGVDTTPTSGSNNIVTSGGIYSAINTAIGSVYRVKGTKATYAELPSSGNVAGDVWNVTAAYGNYPAGTNWVWTGSAWDALGGEIDLSGKQDVLTFDSTPTANSTNPVTSGGVYDTIEEIEEVTAVALNNLNDRIDSVQSDLSDIDAPGTLTTTSTTGLSAATNEALSGSISLHKVSKTGSYNDLLDKPSIPAAQVQSDWNATSGMGVILNKPTIPDALFVAGDGTNGVKQVSIPSYNTTSGNGAVALNNSSTVGNNALSANTGIARGVISTAIGQGLSIGGSSFASGQRAYYNTGYKYSGSGTSFTVTITSEQLEAILGFTDIVGITGRFGTGNNVTTAVITSASWSSSNQLVITTSKDLGTHTNENFYIYCSPTAIGAGSHAEGGGTIALNNYEHAEGKFNASFKVDNIFGNAGNTLYSIGVGTSPIARINAIEVKQNGDVYVKGIGSYDGTNYSASSTLQTVIGNIPSAVTESTVSGWGFTKNTGTVTGVNFNGTNATVANGIATITAPQQYIIEITESYDSTTDTSTYNVTSGTWSEILAARSSGIPIILKVIYESGDILYIKDSYFSYVDGNFTHVYFNSTEGNYSSTYTIFEESGQLICDYDFDNMYYHTIHSEWLGTLENHTEDRAYCSGLADGRRTYSDPYYVYYLPHVNGGITADSMNIVKTLATTDMIPQILSGTSDPASSQGNNGDIYIKLSS